MTEPSIPSLRGLLDRGLRVSLGCTEPVAIALAAGWACRAALGKPHPDPTAVEAIDVRVRLGMYKNALAVRIPHSGGRSGVVLAAALGACCDPRAGLRLLGGVTPDGLERALRLVEAGRVSAALLEDAAADVLVEAVALAGGHRGRAVLAGDHDRLALLERDGVAGGFVEPNARGDGGAGLPAATTIDRLVDAVGEVPLAELQRIGEGLRLNREAMRAGLALAGASVGRLTHAAEGREAPGVGAAAAAASDARMAGEPLPVMSSCGSGNQGILIHVPVALVAEREGIPAERTLRAVALAHLVTQYATDRLGLLSPLCGVYVKAGLGLAAGLCFLLGGDAAAVDRAVRLMVARHAGTVCDGAGPGCAHKVSAAAEGALHAARLALDGLPAEPGRGLASRSAEAAIRHVASLARELDAADRVLFERLRAEAEDEPGAW